MNIDLRTCVPGDILISRRGVVYRYVAYTPSDDTVTHPHRLCRIDDNATASRGDAGKVFNVFNDFTASLSTDIVKILRLSPVDTSIQETVYKL